jgi:mono/diheme cytochrome c family protein
MKAQALLIIFLLISLNFLGCDNTNQVLNDLNFPESNVSYSQHVQTLFNIRCNYASCHGAGTTTNRLVLVSYYDATRYPGIISQGNPDNSVLNQRLEGRLGSQMPRVGDPLSSSFINGVRTWVREGAKNN